MTRPVAVVTGAGRGIGASVAETLAEQGWDLVLGDVPSPDVVEGLGYPLATPEDLAATALRCTERGALVRTAPCDVRDPEAVQALVELAGTGPDAPLRAAVAVAGVLGADGAAWELTPAEIERDLSVNLHGVVNLARAAVPRLLEAADPSLCRVVAVVSSAAERGLPRLAGYVAAKHAALGYVRSLAADLAPHGVTANAVLPGSTRTDLLGRTAQAYGLPSRDAFTANQRIGRLLEPREIAAAVAWLCSPAASGVTGSALSVDGGFTG